MILMAQWTAHFFQWASFHLTARTVLIFGIALLAARLFLGRRGSRLPLPPGPWGVPFVGFLPFLGQQYHLKLTELAKQFGPVYQIYLGGKRIVVVSDHRLVRHAFRKPVFSGRPDTELTKLLQGYGVINSGGALWQEQRTFLHGVLREFGAKNMGPSKAILENSIKAQVNEFLQDMGDRKGAPCVVRPSLARAVSNVVGAMLMSVTFDHNDVGFQRLLQLIEEGFRLLTIAVAVNFIPILRYIPRFNHAYQKIRMNKEETASYFLSVAQRHRKTLDESNVRDFVDAFLLQEKKVKESGKDSYFSEAQLIQVMGDIFSAGLETVTSTLEWAVLFMVRNQEVQRKVQEELDLVVGEERLPSLEDLPRMPYTEATILEVFRRANVIALGNSHATLEDTELGGYFIPKNSHVLPNLWAIHMDSNLWESPEQFMPERFMRDGKVIKPKYFMPFSVGRRMCVGDSLAKMEVFLFLSTLLHHFHLSTPKGDQVPTLEGVVAVSLTTQPYRVCAVRRKDNYLVY